jgi:hypothetical protein
MEEGWDGGETKAYDGERTWSSINHSILSALNWEEACVLDQSWIFRISYGG